MRHPQLSSTWSFIQSVNSQSPVQLSVVCVLQVQTSWSCCGLRDFQPGTVHQAPHSPISAVKDFPRGGNAPGVSSDSLPHQKAGPEKSTLSNLTIPSLQCNGQWFAWFACLQQVQAIWVLICSFRFEEFPIWSCAPGASQSYFLSQRFPRRWPRTRSFQWLDLKLQTVKFGRQGFFQHYGLCFPRLKVDYWQKFEEFWNDRRRASTSINQVFFCQTQD